MRSEGLVGRRERREDSAAPFVRAKRAVKRPGLRVAFGTIVSFELSALIRTIGTHSLS